MNDWQTKRLGDVIKLNYGKSLSVKNRSEGAIPVFGSNGIVGSHNEAIVDMPGIIVGRKGSAGQVHRSLGPFCPIDTTFYITAADAPDTDIDFLFYLLRHIDLTRITGDVGVPGLNREMAYMEPAHFPPTLPEQKKIAYVLSTVERAIEQQERIIQATTELRKALMHKLFTKGLRNEPQKKTEIGPIPESWEVAKIKDHCIESAFGPRFGSNLYAPDGNILTLRTTDMEDDGRIDFSTAPKARIDYDKFKKHYLQEGDIVVSRSGTCGIASVFEGHSMPVLPGAFLIRLRMKPSIQPMFLRHYINSPVGRPYVLQLAQGAIQKNISGTRLGDLSIPLPAIDEQVEISNAVGTIDRKLDIHRRKLKANRDMFRTFLNELMTAKIRVNDIDFDDIEELEKV
jgi:type I restriction enzyme S subunit